MIGRSSARPRVDDPSTSMVDTVEVLEADLSGGDLCVHSGRHDSQY